MAKVQREWLLPLPLVVDGEDAFLIAGAAPCVRSLPVLSCFTSLRLRTLGHRVYHVAGAPPVEAARVDIGFVLVNFDSGHLLSCVYSKSLLLCMIQLAHVLAGPVDGVQ